MTNLYHIRYNTQHGDSDLVWRVFENGQEHLVKNFVIDARVQGQSTQENDQVKWNVCCEGVMTIVDNVAYIKGVK